MIREVQAAIDAQGYAVVEGFLSQEELEALKRVRC